MGWVVRVSPQWVDKGEGVGVQLGRPGGPMACWAVAQWGEGDFPFFFFLFVLPFFIILFLFCFLLFLFYKI